MHQSHNIPWHLLAAHFEPCLADSCNRQKNNRYCPHVLNKSSNYGCPFVYLHALDKPTQTSDLVFFCARFIRALNAFSTTARAKFPSPLAVDDHKSPRISAADTDDRLLRAAGQKRDENHARYAGMSVEGYREARLDGRVMPLGNWLHGYESVLEDRSFEAGADMTKALLDEGCRGEGRGAGGKEEKEEETAWGILLRMARSEKQMGAGARMVLGSVSYGQSHQQGWKTVGWMALEGYMLLNTIMAVPGLMQDDKAGVAMWKRWNRIRRWCRSFTMDNNTQTLPHAQFWRAVGVMREDCFLEINDGIMASADLFQDMDRVQEYSKKCWRLMYGCDLLMKECGIDPDWAGQLPWLLGDLAGMKLDEAKIRDLTRIT